MLMWALGLSFFFFFRLGCKPAEKKNTLKVKNKLEIQDLIYPSYNLNLIGRIIKI